MDIDERNYYLAFSCFSGIGPVRFKLLVDYFGSAKSAYLASEKDLHKIHISEKLLREFLNFRKTFPLSAYNQKLKKLDICAITLFEEDYPQLLSEISDPPFVIYVRGNIPDKKELKKSVAVVGTRKITNYGMHVTRRIAAGLSKEGFIVVSGMAYGVDTVAHEAAIEAGGKTIAVLGCGVNVIHPISNSNLYWKIVKSAGAVISEYPPGRYADRSYFPLRNRIISGLSLGVVVCEGAINSGSMITARYAAEQGREVFAVPGPITSPLSFGPMKLIKDGAKIIQNAQDIIEELVLDK